MFAPTGSTLVTYGLNSCTPLPACFCHYALTSTTTYETDFDIGLHSAVNT